MCGSGNGLVRKRAGRLTTRTFKVTSLESLSDLILGSQKVTLKVLDES